jgi:phosphonate transport system substrate-binding protein
VLIVTGCSVKRAPLGTKDNPLKVFLIPSVDAQMLKDKAKDLKVALEESTGYSIKLSVPSSYIAVVEAFGTKKADVAVMNTFGYLLAHKKYDVEAKLMVTRFGRDTYKSQIIVHSDSDIKNLEDLNGKKFAFVDPASASGHLLAKDLFNKKGIKLGQEMFSQKHDSVVTMVYQKQVDAGATFYSPLKDGKIQDARRLVRTQFPDVEDKVKILSLTDAIPNDPIIFRKEIETEMKEKIVQAFIDFMETPQGIKTFENLYLVDGVVRVDDSKYDSVRKLLGGLGVNLEKMVN